ncbi:hypothetical protein C8R44DRAFT_821674, partial [Mycena epipterygia]
LLHARHSFLSPPADARVLHSSEIPEPPLCRAGRRAVRCGHLYHLRCRRNWSP